MDASDEDEDYDMLREEQERELEEQMERDQREADMEAQATRAETNTELEEQAAQAAAAGPSSGRAGPSSDNGNRNDPDWFDSSEGEQTPRNPRSVPQRAASNSDGGPGASPAPSSVGQGGSASAADNDAATSVFNSRSLHRGLEAIPGWQALIMGQGISPVPPVFNTGMPGYWVQYTNTGPFPSGVKCRPARVIDLGFVAAWQQASDAERVSDMTAQTDPVARARTVSTCALMGLLSVGMSKGYVASPFHSELAQARQRDPEELSKEQKRLNGKVKTYTYCPNASSTDPAACQETAMMFCFVHLAVHNPEGKYVGFKILMLVFDKGFSLDLLVQKVMDENDDINRSGKINGMPEKDRTQKLQQQNKLQRTHLTDDNLESTASTQYKRITSSQDYLKFLESVGGQTEGQHGRPYYADIANDTPPGCAVHRFTKDPNDEWGGQHPIGPSISHNMKRFVPPSDETPGVSVFTAGVLDARGKPIELHECFMDPRLWFDDEGNFDPPQHVKDNGWCHMCHDVTVTNIMSVPLPHKMHGNVEPDDCLLRIFWKLNKESNPILKKAQQRGLRSFEQNRDSVLALFHRMEDSMDPEQQKLARAVLETEMLSADSLDKSAAEHEVLEHRAYGKTQTEKGDKWVLSVRQPLRDISIEQMKVHAMVNDDDKQKRIDINRKDYDMGEGAPSDFDVKGAMKARRLEHAEATRSTIKLGLQRFAHTYGRAKCVKLIPPGYYDVAKVGLDAAVKEAGEIAKRRAERNRSLGRTVDPDNPDAALGTANVGQAHGQALVATDLTPFGHHRAFLMRLFSSGVNIAGRDVKLMLECHVHAFEPYVLHFEHAPPLARTHGRAYARRFQEVSFFLLLCGGPGSGKSMRARRMMALLPEGWVHPSGSASQKAGMNGGFDNLCGRLVYYDGAPPFSHSLP
jgi:hypothetical protein